MSARAKPGQDLAKPGQDLAKPGRDPAKPLAGLLVVTLEQAVAAPYCSSRLADAGARVIKIERAEGDFARGYDAAVNGLASYFVWLNRGKESLVADIKKPDDAALLHRILAKADVFIQNLAPGAAERAGFGSAALRARHPRLITVDIIRLRRGSFLRGDEGLRPARAGGERGSPASPATLPVPAASACPSATSLAACRPMPACWKPSSRAAIDGQGAALEVSLFDGVADWMNVPLLYFEGTGAAPKRVGLAHPSICPYGAFATADDHLVLISIQNEREWANFCAAVLGEPDLPAQTGFGSNTARVAHRPTVDAKIAAVFGALTRDALADRLRGAQIAYGFVNDLADLATHPALRRVSVETERGPAAIVAPPVIRDRQAAKLGRVPAVGEHDALIRRDFAAPAEDDHA